MVRTIAKDYDDKRRHILTVAAEVFAREGIARASMNEVARACGISKANIYHYYATSFATGGNITVPFRITANVPIAAYADLNAQDETYLIGASQVS